MSRILLSDKGGTFSPPTECPYGTSEERRFNDRFFWMGIEKANGGGAGNNVDIVDER